MRHLDCLWHVERIDELRYTLQCVIAECSKKHKAIRLRTIRQIELDIAEEFNRLQRKVFTPSAIMAAFPIVGIREVCHYGTKSLATARIA